MHKIKIGEFKYLAIVILNKDEDFTRFLFYDKSEHAALWFTNQMIENKMEAPQLITFIDMNHLLNKMVKAKGTKAGDALYKVYIDNYPDDEQKQKVINFWKVEEDPHQH